MNALDRLVSIIRRELSADDVRVLEAGAPETAGALRCGIPGNRVVEVSFDEVPADLDARARRLEMLVDSFRGSLSSPSTFPSPSRPPAASSLHDELRAVAERSGALDALVIDARSPVVWAAADAERASPEVPPEEPDEEIVVSLDAHREARKSERASGEHRTAPEAPAVILGASDKAIAAVRALSVLPHLHRGGHLHHSVRAQDFGYVARSFAAIYVLIVVFEAPFDELRVERAIVHALPMIERLVLALPPLDPTPMAGAMAIRRGRRR